MKAPWLDSAWHRAADERIGRELAAVGRPPTGPIATEKSWGRSCLKSVPTDAGTVWVKHGYRLPPGEELVLESLAARWPGRVPTLVATWPGAAAMEGLTGHEMPADAPLADWLSAARVLGELASGEAGRADEWLALGVRDRRPAAWRRSIEELLQAPAFSSLDAELRDAFTGLAPELVSRFELAFRARPTLVHQDSGCCNVALTRAGPVVFDWSDVVVGHATFSCDRLLDQVPPEHQAAVVDAFLAPLELPLDEFRAMRRSNVLHEVLRYHDELAHLDDDAPIHASLVRSVQSQLRVLVEHELGRSDPG